MLSLLTKRLTTVASRKRACARCCDPHNAPIRVAKRLCAGFAGLAAAAMLAWAGTAEAARTTVTLSVNVSRISESSGERTVTVTARHNSGRDSFSAAVTVRVGGGTATEGTDYDTVNDFTLIIQPYSTSGSATFKLKPKQDTQFEGHETISVSGTVAGANVTGATITLADDDIELSASPRSVYEDDGATTVTVTARAGTSSSARTVAVTVGASGDGATEGTDYSTVNDFNITIAANASSGTGTFTLTPTNDNVLEGSETITVSGSVANHTVNATSVTLVDMNVITLSVNPSTVREDAGRTSVTVTATAGSATSSARTVRVSVGGGTATEGTDYLELLDFNLTIAANQTTGTSTIYVSPIQDGSREQDETIMISGSISGYTVSTATLKLQDDDRNPDISLDLNASGLSEGGNAKTIEVTLFASVERGWARTVTVQVGKSGDSAAEGTDYSTVDDFTIRIPPSNEGVPRGKGSFTLTPTQDTDIEGIETITVSGSYSTLAVGTDYVNLYDDDTTTITLSANKTSVSEGASATSVTVTATAATAQGTATAVTVNVGSNSTAVASTDYAIVNDFTITIPANQTSATGTFTLTPTQDTEVEGNETIRVDGSASHHSVTGTSLSLTDDDTHAITLSASPASVGEGASGTTVTVTATAGSAISTARTVAVAVGGSGTATSGTDYAAVSNFNITIAANATSGTGTFTLTPTNDSSVEGDETIGISGSGTLMTVTGTTLTLSDNDTHAVTLSASPTSVGEDASATTVTVTATATAISTARTVTVSVGDTGTAVVGEDFATVSDFDITIAANATSGTGTFTLTPTNDSSAEGNETIGITGSGTLLTVTGASMTLTDDDVRTLSLSANKSTVSEGAGATTVTVTATANSAVSASTTVKVTVGDSTDGATSGTDYTAVDDFTITIAANATKGTGTFTLTPTQDTTYEGEESVSVTGTSSPHTVTGTSLAIGNDDGIGITLSANPTSVVEGGGSTSVTVTATANKTALADISVTVQVGKSTDSATEGTDYPTVNDFTLTIDKGEKTGTATFNLIPNSDKKDTEENETISIDGSSSPHTVTGTSLTLTNAIATNPITLSVSPSSVGEAAGATTVTVTARMQTSFKGAGDVTVTVGTSGSAKSGTDYGAVSDIKLSFTTDKPTTATGTFTLTPTDDAVVENNETVWVDGSSNWGQVVGASVTINDNDGAAITLSANKTSVSEGASGTSVTVTATAGAASSNARTVTVAVGANGDGAIEGTDYADVSDFSITIAANATSGTGTFTLTPTQDTVVEGSESLTISGSGSQLNVSSTSISLTDDDTAPSVNLSLSPTNVTEGAKDSGLLVGSYKTVTATATFSPANTYDHDRTVAVSVGGSGTATSGTDYTAVSNFNVKINAGATSGTGTFQLTSSDDDVYEGDETIGVAGTSTGLTVNSVNLTLADNDSAAVTVDDASATEGSSMTFTVTLDKAVQGGLKVTPSYTNVTAADADYTANTAALTFTGTANETRTFTVSTVDDEVVEDIETFTVGLSVSDAPSGVTSTDTGTGTINRVAGSGGDTATVTINDASAEEGSSMTFTVTLDKAVQGGLTVTPSYTNVTAADADYTANTAALTFSGTANETRTFTVSTTEDDVMEDTETFTVSLSVSDAPSGVTVTDTGTGTINNDDSATVTVNDASAAEGSSMTFTVTLDKAVQGGLTVTPDFTDGTAVEGTDYDANTAALTFSGTANETRTFTVSTTEDAVMESNETFTVGLSVSDAPSGVTVTDTGTGTINNDDSATVTVNDASADEGDSMTFTVTLDKAVQGGLTVTPSYTDVTAVEGTDYGANTAALTFSGTANETRTFTVSTTEDAVMESNETFTVGLSVSDAPSGVTSTDTGTGTINNDDGATVTVNDASADEGDSMTFTVTLGKAVQGGLTVTPDFTDGTAVEGTDYDANTAALTFSGTANETRTFTVSTTEDAVVEGDETFTVGLTVSGTTLGVTATDTGTGTVEEDDGTTVTVSDASALEGESTTFTVTLSNAVQGGLTVTPSYTDVTADKSADYTENTTALTFTGTANETHTFTVSTTEDTVVEGDESFTVAPAISGLSTGVSGVTGVAGAGTITDDDSTDLTLTATPASVGEGAGGTTVTVKAATDGDTFKTARTVTVSVGESGDSADSGTDYTAVSDFTITITAGETSGTGTFTLTPTNDTEIEGDETITVAGTSTGLTVTGAEVTLADDDFDISSAATFADAEAVEGEALTFTVTLNNGVKNGFEVTPVITGGTATSEQDYKTELSPSLLVFAGTAGEQQTFTVSTIDDRVVEHEETVTVSFTVSDTRVSGVPDSALGLIVDNDIARLKISNARAEEGDSLTFTMTLSNAVSGGFKARPVFMDGTAVEGSDYQGNRPTLEFSGTSGESRSVTVPSLEDGVVEDEEWFNIGLSVSGAPAGLRVGAGVGVIEDDDEAVLTVSDARGEEGEGLVFTVTLDNEVQSGFTVRPVFTDGSAEEGSDYRENRSALEFSGVAGESHTFEVPSLEDGVVEYDEDFTVGLDTTEVPAGVKVVSGVGVIEDDDEAVLTVSDASAKEGEALVFTVTLDSAVQGGFTVRPVFTDGSAEEGVDYTENRPALEFSGAAGESRTFEVMSLEDAVVEYDEEFTVSLDLTEGPGGLQTAAPGTGTIVDGTETVVRVSEARAEEGEDLVFTVTLENAVVGGLTLTPSYADGTALEGTDYTENVTVLTFAGTAGESQEIAVSSVEDGLVEGDETFTLRVSVTEAPAGVSGSEATGTVEDDDRLGEGVEVRVSDVSVEEGSPLVFTVSLAQAVPDNIVMLRYATRDGTAHAGEDYTAVSGTFTFAAGETEKTVEVATLDDEFDEGSETMELRLSEAVNGKLTDPAGTGTITNDDPLPKAWLARFGRTVGEHVMGAIDARLHGDSTGSHLTVGGVTAQKLEEGEGRRPVGSFGLSGAARGASEGKGTGWAVAPGDGALGFGAAGFGSGTDEFGAAGPGAKEMTTRELLASSAFRWRLGASGEDSAAGSGLQWTSWGSGAATRFDGRERSVTLDGEVVGMTLGVDAEWGPWTAGMALAYNDGRGSYDDAKSGKSGKTWSTLTSAHPYLRWQKEGLSVWGLVGHGQGEYAVAPGDGDETVRTDMGMNMAGVGARRTLAPAPGGVELALRADGMFVRMNSDAVAGRLQETRTETRHLRLLLEGSRSFGVGNGGVLTPSLETGVRHDAGDAERGFGLEVNARVRYEDTARGLTVEARGRGMVAHEVKGYEVWGASGSVFLDPGSDRLGLSLRVQPSWGAPESGVESLWDQGAAEGGSLGGSGTGARLDTELGYGVPALEGRGVFTLQTGFGMDDGGAHRVRVGGVLDTDNGFELSLSGEQTLPHEGEPEYEVALGIRFAL